MPAGGEAGRALRHGGEVGPTRASSDLSAWVRQESGFGFRVRGLGLGLGVG